MSDILAPNPTHHVKLEVEPSTTLGGTPIPFHAERFGSTSHSAPSVPVVEATSYLPPRSRVSDPIRIRGPRRVTIGTSTYLITELPSSLNPNPSNSFLMTLPPPNTHGPSGQNIDTS